MVKRQPWGLEKRFDSDNADLIARLAKLINAAVLETALWGFKSLIAHQSP
jgi:hypothetical protein